MTASAFYDRLAPHYHLIFEDWTASIERQGAALDSIIRSASGGSARSVVDVACGIGTQTLGLAARGYEVTASDVSRAAIERARIESVRSKLAMDFSVADMRDAYRHHQRTFDVVLCADNSLPHLLTDSDILKALQQFLACTRPGGLCLVSVRDYDAVQRDGVHFRPYGVRTEAGARYVLFQVWSWRRRCTSWIFTSFATRRARYRTLR